MRLRQPMRRVGVSTERWAGWRRTNREIVMRRCDYGAVCEGCGGRMRPLELAHLAGRNNKGVGEPWASSAELTAGLCASGYGEVGCHQKIDQALDLALLDRLRWAALGRLWASFPDDIRDDWNYGTALDNIRSTIAHLVDRGWGWNGSSIVQFGEIVKA